MERKESLKVFIIHQFLRENIVPFEFTNLPKWLMFLRSNKKEDNNTFIPIALLSQDHKYAATIN